LKTCSLCQKTKETTAFYTYKARSGSRLPQSRCIVCQRATAKTNYKATPYKWNREEHLKRRYGITVAQYDEMLANQNNVCWICKRPPKKKRLSVDHNHKTGKVRGLLCYSCNYRLLPGAHEDPDVLLRAADYLNQNN
jgi:hypothetical protein